MISGKTTENLENEVEKNSSKNSVEFTVSHLTPFDQQLMENSTASDVQNAEHPESLESSLEQRNEQASESSEFIYHRKKSRRHFWIPVVAAFIRKEGRILIGQRPETHSLAGLWEFPGGKIELGETPEIALQRELEEELGIQAEIGNLQLACTHSYKEVGIVILFYEVLFWKNEPKTKHHLQLEWIYPEELKTRKIPEANVKLLPKILKCLGAIRG